VGGTSNFAGLSFTQSLIPFLAFEETNGDFLAKDVVQSAHMYIVDVPPGHSLTDVEIVKQIANKAFVDFQTFPGFGAPQDKVPHDKGYLQAALDHALTDDEVKELKLSNKVLISVGAVIWSDSAGRHEREMCNFLSASFGAKVETSSCPVHDGYIDKAAHHP
jgi:hypothetical protein